MSAPPEGNLDAYVRARLQALASYIEKDLPTGWGFFLMTYPYVGREGRANYISKTPRDEVIKLMREWIARNDVTPDMFKHLEEPARKIETDPLNQVAGGQDEGAYCDTDLMPFGKHKGTPLQDVPASYLHYLWSKRPISDRRLENYIRNNLIALRDELPDAIW